jgi:hypothetical protein
MIKSSNLTIDFVKFEFVEALLNGVTFGVKLVCVICVRKSLGPNIIRKSKYISPIQANA